MRVVDKTERNEAFAQHLAGRSAGAHRRQEARTLARSLDDPRKPRLRQDHQGDGRGRAARDGRRREGPPRRPQGRRDPADLVEGPLRAARPRQRRLHARPDAGLHRRDPRVDRRRAAPRRDHGDSEQALHALLQLPAVLGRRNAPDARAGPARDRSRPPGRARARPDAAQRGRVPLHAAPHQRGPRVERLVVDGLGLRQHARA